MMKFALALPLLFITTQVLAETIREDDLQYRVVRGDTLIGLAERGLKRWQDYRVVQQHNRISDPRKLQAGTILAIPRRLVRVEPVFARVIALRGSVTLNGEQARLNMVVKSGEIVRSGAVSFLTMQLADGSLLTVPSNSQLDVINLRKILLTGAVEKRFRLQDGRVETEVKPLRQEGDTFEIQTPVSTAAVRGTRYRVTYQANTGRGGTSVLEGAVAVESGNQQQVINAGNGVSLSTNALGALTALLPALEMADAESLQDGPQVRFHPDPVQGAAAYRAQVATDAGFVDLFAENESKTPDIEIPDVPDGSYFVRLTAISAGGIEGLPVSYTVERRRNDVSASVDEASECPVRRCLRFRWQSNGEGQRLYRFQLLPDQGGVPVIDEAGMSDMELVVTDLPPGTYYWRIQSSGDSEVGVSPKWMDLQQLHVAPLKH